MAEPKRKLVKVDDSIIAFPDAMPDEHVARAIKSFRAKKTPQPLATEESEQDRQLKPAQPLSTAIPSLPQWANTPLSPILDKKVDYVDRALWPGGTANWDKGTAAAEADKQKFMTNHPIGGGIFEGVSETAEGLTTPANLALMILAPESKIMSGLFAIQSLHGSYKDVEEARKAYREGRNAEASKYATQAILNLGIAGLAGHHAVKDIPVPEPVKAFMKDESGFVDPIKQWPQFKQWFGNSKVVEQNGAPRAVFHSTPEEFDEFDPRKSHDIGIHFGTPEQADAAAKPIGKYREGTRLIPAYIKVENPLRVKDMFSTLKNRFINRAKILTLDTPGLYFSSDERAEIYDAAKKADAARSKAGGDYSIELIPSNAKLREEYNTQSKRFWSVAEKAIRRNGYDGLVYNNKVEGKGDSYAVFEPTQIKSAIGNSGAFDPKSGSLTDPRAPKLADVKAKAAELKPTTAYKSADQSQPFYLKSENLINEKMKGPMPAEDVHRMLLSNGVKPEEMKWTGLDELLTSKGKQKVTPQEIQEHLAGNNLQIQEVTKGAPSRPSSGLTFDSVANQEYGKPFSELTDKEKGIVKRVFDEQLDSFQAGEPTKFGSYALPGAEPGSYRELLVTMPPKTAPQHFIAYKGGPTIGQGYANLTEAQSEMADLFPNRDDIEIRQGRGDRSTTTRTPENFRSSHWDEPNVLGHVRFNDRTGPNGERILHLEELQSDWGQHIRSEGVKKSPVELAKLPMKAARHAGFWEIHTEDGQFVTNVQEWEHPDVKTDEDAIKEARRRIIEAPNRTKIVNKGHPDMPFKKTEDWAGLLFKRMMRYAAEKGYDGISWTPGEEQVKRYPNLSEVTDRLMYDPKTETLRTWKYDNNESQSFNVPPEKLSDHIGKEATQRLLNSPLEEGEHVLEGEGLITGGKGQRVFYDTMVPQMANKLGKQWGAKVGETKINTGRPTSGEGWEQTKMWDQFRSDGRRGQMPLYAIFDRGGNWVGTTGDPSSVDDSGGEETAVKVIDEKGNLLKDAKLPSTQKSVPYLPITPQMRAGVKSIPYSLFSIPLAAGALTLQQVKAQGDELQKKFKPTGVTK